MARKQTDTQDFRNVGAGNKVVLPLGTGLTLDELHFVRGGTFTAAQLENISFEINSKPIISLSDAARLDTINNYYTRPETANHHTLFFRRPEMATLEMQRLTALGTDDVENMRLKAKINAAAIGPTLEGYQEQSEPQVLGLITKYKEGSYNVDSTSQWKQITDLPTGPRIMALHFFKADITEIEIEIGSIKLVASTTARLDARQKRAGRTPQTGVMTTVDFCLEGDIWQSLITEGAQEMIIRVKAATTGALDIVTEYLDGWEGL